MLTISNLHVKVEGKEILKGIDLTIPDKEVHALFGPNGSGKSVLISTIMGSPEYEITKGQILYNNQTINNMDIDERVKLGISFLEQRPPTIKGVKLKDIANIILQNNSNKKNELIMDELIKEFKMKKFLNRNINEGFSGGEIKKSEIFLLILTQPDFIILDEPDSGVDPEHLRTIGQMINKSLNLKAGQQHLIKVKKSGLIATHSAAILDYLHTNKAHILMDGKIKCSGNPSIMMDQIRKHGYGYCIKCQQN